MPTAKGRIEGIGNNFNAIFKVEGHSKKFAGSFTTGVARFKSGEASLKYYKLSELNDAYEITVGPTGQSSFVGVDSFKLELKNEGDINMEISGKLDIPIDERQAVTGLGKWFEAKEDD
ncbi:hypothetical protein F5887DRAFT_1238174 [Amanita rubescens]|nr:hypothetical protein F5887DRAFT_1238174 [Amanita rubescens]